MLARRMGNRDAARGTLCSGPWGLPCRLGIVTSPFPGGRGQKQRQGEDLGPTVFMKKGAGAAPGLHFGQVPGSPSALAGPRPSTAPQPASPSPKGGQRGQRSGSLAGPPGPRGRCPGSQQGGHGGTDC